MASEPNETDAPRTPSGPTQGMPDIPRGTLVGLIASGLLLISVFFSWYSVHVKVAGISNSASASGWDSTDVAKLVFLLALIALVALGLEQFVPTVELPVPASMVAGVCGILALLFVLFRIVSKPGGGSTGSFNIPGSGNTGDLFSVSVGTSWGIWFSLLAAIGVIVGAYLSMNESNS